MEIISTKDDIFAQESDLLVIGAYQGEDLKEGFLSTVNEMTEGAMSKQAKLKEFDGKAGQSLFLPLGSDMQASYLLILGLGEVDHFTEEVAREATGTAMRVAFQHVLSVVSMQILGAELEDMHARSLAKAQSEAALLSQYQYTNYKKPKTKFEILSLSLTAPDGRSANSAKKGIEDAVTIIDGVTVARDLVNTPAQDMKPMRLAQVAENIAKMAGSSVRVRVYNREQCEKKKMGAFLAVAQGSDAEPRFIHLTYKPEGRAKKVIALVGKGVTFDSGGLSLKPGPYMETMKCDMAGAAAVLGTFATLARLKPKVEVHGIIPATENMVNGIAMRPGDVIKASNGKTIEVLNTDAEGRLILADGLHYASKLNPDYMIDLATLTGACVVALGEEVGAVMSNDDAFRGMVIDRAGTAGEKMWPIPLEPRYNALLESPIADLRNISTSRYGGSITAGLFLQNFVGEGIPWVHLDIAGPAFAERPLSSYIGKGGSGFGVRTLVELLRSV